jgi:hypothetical protein
LFSLISAVENVPAVDDKKGYQHVHTSSPQSTSCWNIFTVNALNSCKMSVQGRKDVEETTNNTGGLNE